MELIFSSEKGELGPVAAAKIDQITAELQSPDSKPFDAVERLKSGFIHFKKEKYEYEISILPFSIHNFM